MGFVKNILILILAAAILSASVLAAGFETTGLGTQARGMAGAFRAIANDWTAAYYNPAGYGYLYDNELGSNFSFLHYRHELVPNYFFGDIYESGIFNDVTNYNKHEILNNPSGGFAVRLPVWGETVFGLSAYSYFDNNLTWNMYDIPYAYNDLLFLPDDQFSSNLDVVAFQMTIAKTFNEDKFAVGLGLQLLRADLVHSDVIFRDNPFGAPLGVRPWDKVVEWNKNQGNGYGFGFIAGVLFNATEELKVGLNARVPFDINVSGESALEYYMPLIETIDGSGDSAAINNPGYFGTAGNLFVAGDKIVDSADFDTKLKLPSSFGIGLSYQATASLTLAVDAEMTLWSKYEGLNFAFSNHRGLTGAADTSVIANRFFTADVSYPVEWSNTTKIMAGFTYDYKDIFTFLGGFSTDQSPVRDNVLQTPQFFDTGTKNSFSGGIIWHYTNWDFGLTTSYTDFPELDSPDLVDLDGNGQVDNFNGLYKGGLYETVFSFIYRF